MKLLVSNLPEYVTTRDIKQLFETVGKVRQVEVITERHHAYAKVEMDDQRSGQKAIDFLNGLEMDGGLIEVALDSSTTV